MTVITTTATEHPTASEAVQDLDASGVDRAFSVGGRFFSGTSAEFERIERAGVQPTTWHDRDGRLVSVPGRNG
jgi:hypothetical protein